MRKLAKPVVYDVDSLGNGAQSHPRRNCSYREYIRHDTDKVAKILYSLLIMKPKSVIKRNNSKRF